MSHSERDLIARATAGDTASFESLVQPHESRLLRVIMAVTPNREDAEDCLQETLLQAYRALPSFRAEAALETWLHRIALNVTRNWLRAQARASSARIGERYVRLASPDQPALDAQLIAAETSRALRREIAVLPDHYREPLVLRHYRDMSYEQIAEVLRIPLGTVRSRLAQARTRLLQRLQAHGHVQVRGQEVTK